MDIQKLKGHIPDNVIEQLPDTIAKFGLDTPLKLAHFLAQVMHESGNFKSIIENLNYGAKGLRSIFSKYFPTDDKANLYERKPEKIANLIYANRMGNGSEISGEGYKFRGRGYIQLTGKDNYALFSKAIGEDCVTNPDLVSTKYPLASAAWFFQRCLSKCTDASVEAITAVTKCVNGGHIGIEERIKNFNIIYNSIK